MATAKRIAVAKKVGTSIPGTGKATTDLGRGLAPIAPVTPPIQIADPPPVASRGFSGGGGGGGTAARAAAPSGPPAMDLQGYLTSNDFLLKQQEAENGRLLDDYDSETTRLTQETQQDQMLKRADLQKTMAALGRNNAEDFAGRGLGRSGLVFQGQNEIDEQGVDAENSIAELLTSLTGERGRGRVDQEARNRSAVADKIAQLTSQFNQTQASAF